MAVHEKKPGYGILHEIESETNANVSLFISTRNSNCIYYVIMEFSLIKITFAIISYFNRV